jgi:hypothetical protein
MDSQLEANRTYKSSAFEYNCLKYWEYIFAALKNQPHKQGYIIMYNSKTPEEIINNESMSKIYSVDKFTIFRYLTNYKINAVNFVLGWDWVTIVPRTILNN